uniref:CBS domain-containing protein n=1 Tax=Syphacia muris TaxID=451379 RepID=A0A0N5AAB6_9BILA
MSRQRSESLGNAEKLRSKHLKKVQIENCPLHSVYDLREEDESDDVYNDSLAFRRPRSNSSDFLILRKTSRPLSVDVVGLVDEHDDPYKQYMQVVDCYELAPHKGSVVLLDDSIKLHKAFRAMSDWCLSAALVWSEVEQSVVSIVTLTDFLVFLTDSKPSTSTIGDMTSVKPLVSLDASCNLLEASRMFCTKKIHRIAITEPTGDILYLLTVRRILQAIHKQNRSLHFALWMGCDIKDAGLGNWGEIHFVNEGQKLQEVGRLMIKHNFSSIPVVDLCGRPIDVITKFDIAAALSAVADVKECFQNYTVHDVTCLRPPAKFLRSTDSVSTVLSLALEQPNCRCVFVASEGRIDAAISLSDFMSHIVYH